MADSVVETALRNIGLSSLVARFVSEKVDKNVIGSLTDSDLTRLGVETIGDRVRLRDEVKLLQASDPTASSSTNERPGRNELFRPGRLSSRIRRRASQKVRSWTASFVCLSDKNALKIPNASEKVILQNSGLGHKRISMPVTANETTVRETLIKNFEKLKQAGGFELMKVRSDCRQLEILNSNWDAVTLKTIFGCQSKIYIRPIQENLAVEPPSMDNVSSNVTAQCNYCKQQIVIRNLREHVKWCSLKTEISDSGEEQLPELHESESVSNNQAIDIEEGDEIPGQSENNLDERDQTEDGSIFEKVIEQCKVQRIENPVDILKVMQDEIVLGRRLEIENEAEDIGEGKTNFILVDRNNLFETAFEEFGSIENLRYTLEVQFYGETAVDNGGPRKEFFRLMLIEMRDSFFSPLREDHAGEQFEFIGKVLALSLLQNGTLPRILDPDLLEEVFHSEQPRPNILALKRGLDALGIVQITKALPPLIHLFTPQPSKQLTHKMITQLLKPNFSENGTNNQVKEARMYRKFLKYMKEAASGRRGNVSLNKILMFATSAEEEPVLGFKIHPSIHFVESESPLPTANTCISRLNLPRTSDLADDKLFKMFDMAFCNAYFGLQ